MSNRTGLFYSAEEGFIGYGAQLLVGNGASPEVFEAVAGVTSIAMPETMFADVDITHLRSPNRHKEHKAGMRDSTEMGVEGTYLPSEWSLLAAGGGSGAFASGGLPTLSEDGINRNFIVRLPTGSPELEVACRGYIKGFSLTNIGTEEKVGYKFAVMPAQAIELP